MSESDRAPSRPAAQIQRDLTAGVDQRQGLGGTLLGHAIRLAREAGSGEMFLEVRPSNPAGVGLYQRNGFEVVGRRPDYYRSDDGREDAIVMRRALAS